MGVLLAVVSEVEGRLTSIIAPVAIQNDLLGYDLDLNYFGFPSEQISYKLYFSHSIENFWKYSAKYRQEKFFRDYITFEGNIEFFRAASERFYGIGPRSKDNDETSYTVREVAGYLTATVGLTQNLYGLISIKGRRQWPGAGVVDNVDSTLDIFPNLRGIEGNYSLPLELAFIYDSRDDNISPTSGIYGKIFFEVADDSFLSSSSFRRVGVELKGYFAKDSDKRFTTVLRGKITYLKGENVPFVELSMLGGEETLRGYGEGRFYDNHSISFNVEERIRMFRFMAGDILLDVEAAIFMDSGQVFPSFEELKFKNTQAVIGLGVRFVVRGQIVAKVDIGYGKDGSAIFAGLDYPF